LIARIVGVDAWLADLTADLTTELAAGMERSGELVAAAARDRHDYVNRTGTLEERTMVGGPVVTTDTYVAVRVVADTRYGKYIEEGTKNLDGSQRIRPRRFLAQAAERCESAIVGEMNAALERAGEKASQ